MLIFIDGIDGSGKSTLVDDLLDRILNEDISYYGDLEHPVHTFQFPTRMPERTEKASVMSRTMFHLMDFFETMRNHRGVPGSIRIFDRSFISTMAYQGFNERVGDLQLSSRFDAIMALGAEALLTTQNPSDLEDSKQVLFLHVKCAPSVAAERIQNRLTDRVDVAEMQTDKQDLIEYLETLQDRLKLSYAQTRMRIGNLFPQHDYYFHEIDSTETGTPKMVEQIMEHIIPLWWPRQSPLF